MSRLPYFLDGMDLPSWYRPDLGREEAHKLVALLPRGRFLVRKMGEPHCYQLHIKESEKTGTFTISEVEEDLSFQFGPRAFPNLGALVHKIASTGLKSSDGTRVIPKTEHDPYVSHCCSF